MIEFLGFIINDPVGCFSILGTIVGVCVLFVSGKDKLFWRASAGVVIFVALGTGYYRIQTLETELQVFKSQETAVVDFAQDAYELILLRGTGCVEPSSFILGAKARAEIYKDVLPERYADLNKMTAYALSIADSDRLSSMDRLIDDCYNVMGYLMSLMGQEQASMLQQEILKFNELE